MNSDDNVNQESAELINRSQDGNKRVQEQDSVDEGKLNGIAEHVKGRQEGAVRAPSLMQVPQQQTQGKMVCWERFLRLRSLKVLLVEKDDCTRHVVAALLRNCSYDVLEAASGLQAWRILDDVSYHIDLILTEVAMPFLSGIGLLSKIANHKTRHNVPVIMMSSHDSMGLVFKCLSKGAVDFLVKPIRKNELKNLWQHVWRRCHSSSGSGSESGTQTQKSVKSKNVEKSDNNTGSNDEDENESIDLNVGDGSDDGNGTQSSWTKQVVEAESHPPIDPLDQIVECPDSTRAQVIHSNAETSVIKQVHVTSPRECQGQEEQLDQVLRDKELEIGPPGGMNLHVEFPNYVTETNVLEVGHDQSNEQIDNVEDELNTESTSNKRNCETPDLMGIATKTTITQMDNPELEAPNRLLSISDSNHKAIAAVKELPYLKFSLKRERGVKDSEASLWEERNVLRRSDSSAFSRYNATSSSKMGPSRNIGKSFPVDNNTGVLITEIVQNIHSHLNSDPPNQLSNGGSNNIDMGSTTNKSLNKPLIMKNKSVASSSIRCLDPSSAFQPLKNNLLCSQLVKHDKSGDGAAVIAQPRDLLQEVQIQHIHHHYSHHIVHSMHQQQLPSDQDELSMKNMETSVPRRSSSNVLEGNAGNSSFYGSVSGSNFGSNGHIGSNKAVNAGGANVESDNAIPGKSGSGDASGSGSGNGNRVDQNKLKQREAALTKFRLKRKERCFRKKVRYQNRKKLAEQRPRVRGQFVRQKSSEHASQTWDM